MENQIVEHEICGNCKKEIPQHNYVMHTAHCARNITLCPNCKEPIPKQKFDEHKKTCQAVKKKHQQPRQATPPSQIEESPYFKQRKDIEDKKAEVRKAKKNESLQQFVDVGHSLKTSNVNNNDSNNNVNNRNKNSAGSVPIAKKTSLLACKYCELELPKLELEEHENYCGSRTDKCLECGELVMFKYKQIHMDSNHGFLKLKDEPGPRPSWDSSTQRSSSPVRRSSRPFSGFDSTLYNFPSSFSPIGAAGGGVTRPKEKPGESYKEISRRLDCKTEYIRNLLHDSASITVPLRHNGAVPRNHFNHNKGPAPQPPRRRRNPPTELTIPCEFCNTPIPHEELIEHETGCRPDLARFNPRRRSASDFDDDFYAPPEPSSPDVELPCEFCSDMIPASQLLRHQATCS